MASFNGSLDCLRCSKGLNGSEAICFQNGLDDFVSTSSFYSFKSGATREAACQLPRQDGNITGEVGGGGLHGIPEVFEVGNFDTKDLE